MADKAVVDGAISSLAASVMLCSCLVQGIPPLLCLLWEILALDMASNQTVSYYPHSTPHRDHRWPHIQKTQRRRPQRRGEAEIIIIVVPNKMQATGHDIFCLLLDQERSRLCPAGIQEEEGDQIPDERDAPAGIPEGNEEGGV